LGPHDVGVLRSAVDLIVHDEHEPQLELPGVRDGEVVHPLPLHFPVPLDVGVRVRQRLVERPEVVQAVDRRRVARVGHVGQPHLDGVVDGAVLVVRYPHDHAGDLVHGEVVGIVVRLAAGAEEVELGEVLPLLGHGHDVAQGHHRGEDGQDQDDAQRLVQLRLLAEAAPHLGELVLGLERKEGVLGLHPPPCGGDGEGHVEDDQGD